MSTQWKWLNEYQNLISLFIGWLLKVPATIKCISGTDILRQLFVLSHWDRRRRSNLLSHPVTVYSHRASLSEHWRQVPGRAATTVPVFNSLVSFFFCFSLVRWKLQSPRRRRQYIVGPPGYRIACGLRDCGLARFPFWVIRRGGRIAANVLLSYCQYRKGTARYGKYGV